MSHFKSQLLENPFTSSRFKSSKPTNLRTNPYSRPIHSTSSQAQIQVDSYFFLGTAKDKPLRSEYVGTNRYFPNNFASSIKETASPFQTIYFKPLDKSGGTKLKNTDQESYRTQVQDIGLAMFADAEKENKLSRRFQQKEDRWYQKPQKEDEDWFKPQRDHQFTRKTSHVEPKWRDDHRKSHEEELNVRFEVSRQFQRQESQANKYGGEPFKQAFWGGEPGAEANPKNTFFSKWTQPEEKKENREIFFSSDDRWDGSDFNAFGDIDGFKKEKTQKRKQFPYALTVEGTEFYKFR